MFIYFISGEYINKKQGRRNMMHFKSGVARREAKETKESRGERGREIKRDRERYSLREYVTWIPRNVFAKCRKYKRTRFRRLPGTVVYINSLHSLVGFCVRIPCMHAALPSALPLSLSLPLFIYLVCTCLNIWRRSFRAFAYQMRPGVSHAQDPRVRWSMCDATGMMPPGRGAAKRSSAASDDAVSLSAFENIFHSIFVGGFVAGYAVSLRRQ